MIKNMSQNLRKLALIDKVVYNILWDWRKEQVSTKISNDLFKNLHLRELYRKINAILQEGLENESTS